MEAYGILALEDNLKKRWADVVFLASSPVPSSPLDKEADPQLAMGSS